MTDLPSTTTTLLSATDLTRVYPVRVGLRRRKVPLFAVSEVSFSLAPARTLAVVGESGCGKSTLARMVTLLERPTAVRSPSTAGRPIPRMSPRGVPCRWYSRIPTAHSIRAALWRRSSKNR